MTDDDSAPLTRRAAREARRVAEQARGGASGSSGSRPVGWQPPLREPGDDSVDDAALTPRPPRGAVRAPQEEVPIDLVKPADRGDDATAGGSAESPADVDGTGGPVILRRSRRGTGGLAQAGAEDFSLAKAVGGVRGAVETLVPGLLFVVVYTVTRDLTTSLAVSVGAAVVAIVLRVLTRSAPSQALSGAVGVGICAVFALLSGEARNFYLPGFLTNVGYGLLCLLSTIRFPRVRVPGTGVHVGPGPYPLIGLLLGPLTGEGLAWRRVPARLRAYQRVTWLWAGFFLLRLVVQVPLYLADLIGPLGAARLAMGVPAFALMVWLTWLVLRAVPAARAEPSSPPPEHRDTEP